jgi:hypothetical protein
VTFLSRAEWDYLSVDKTRLFSAGYSPTIREYRLLKKVEGFTREELDVTEFSDVIENSKAWTAQPGRAVDWDSNNEKK